MKHTCGTTTGPRSVVRSPTPGARRIVAVRSSVSSTPPPSKGPMIAKRIGDAAAVWVLAIGYAMATAVSLHASESLELGEEVFSNNCAACHAGGGNVVAAGRTLEADAISQYLDGGLNVESVVKQVQNGKNAMPAWSGRLDEDEIQSVSEYVYNQSKNNLW
ncbi:TPA: hypothetical protein ACH3X1_005815 [Trebouxia sp. C0004]